MPRARLVAFILALVLACDRAGSGDEARELAVRALTGVLVYPQSTPVSVAAGDEAAEAVFSSSAPVRDVANWYRRVLVTNGWDLKSDVQDAGGVVSLQAEQGGRPLWITFRPVVGGPGTTYTLVGTLPKADSTP